ncbi:MAG: hypothetical protein QNJ98_14630 [Planctomycetota bacterium]|nr:hypothetical protein [Planctomycetota bacterium]
MTQRPRYALTLGFSLLFVIGLGAPLVATGEPEEGLKVGAPAPTFRLNDQEGKVVDPLATARKAERWLILAFFPKALTPG